MRTKCTGSRFCECINCERAANGLPPLGDGYNAARLLAHTQFPTRMWNVANRFFEAGWKAALARKCGACGHDKHTVPCEEWVADNQMCFCKEHGS
jgi:hypothetical protein